MSEISANILIPIVTAIVGAVVGVLFQNLLVPPSKNSYVINNNNGRMMNLNFANIHIEQNQIIKETKIIREKRIERRSESSDGDISGSIILMLIISAGLIWLYLKYQSEIHNGLLIGAVFVASMCLSAIYVITRRNIEIDRKFKTIITWIIISTIFVPIGLYLLQNPLYFKSVNKETILEVMNNNGLAELYTQFGVQIYGFLLYQVIGVVAMILFIIHLIVGNLHIWAMVNLSLGSKGKFIWKPLYKVTYPFCRSVASFIGFSVFLIIVSFLFISGILANLFTSGNLFDFLK